MHYLRTDDLINTNFFILNATALLGSPEKKRPCTMTTSIPKVWDHYDRII